MYTPSLHENPVPEEIIEFAYKKLFESFGSVIPMTEASAHLFREATRAVRYNPKDIIVDYGDVCNHLVFVHNGQVMSTFILDGVEKIVWFMGRGDVVLAVDSWYNKNQSHEKIIALKETVGILMGRREVESLVAAHHDFAMLVLWFTEKHLQLSLERNKWLQLSTEGKIDALKGLYPHIFEQVPGTYIASFLGISKETLYRRKTKDTD